MRAGTQTLIQAIQAIPWADEPENDDEILPPIAANSDSGEEDHLGMTLFIFYFLFVLVYLIYEYYYAVQSYL